MGSTHDASATPPLVAVILDAARPYDRLIIGGIARDCSLRRRPSPKC